MKDTLLAGLWWMLGAPTLAYIVILAVFHVPREEYVIVLSVLEGIGFLIFAIRASR